jgi:hypothetical protein
VDEQVAIHAGHFEQQIAVADRAGFSSTSMPGAAQEPMREQLMLGGIQHAPLAESRRLFFINPE